MALINIFLDFLNIIKIEINMNKFESNVHFLTDLDSFFKGEVEVLYGSIILFMLIVVLSLL